MYRLLLAACVTLVLADLGYSFLQHAGAPFDGDMPENVLPAEHIAPVLSDPLGLGVVLRGETYPNPNRFFSHWSQYAYFNTAPTAFGHLAGAPLDAAFASAAFAKTCTQATLLAILAAWGVGGFRWRTLGYWATALLLTPLFQTNGYGSTMGIVDQAPTYVFFYGIPMVSLMVYLTPATLAWRGGRALHLPRGVRWCWPLLALPVCLSGPLNPGIIAVTLMLFVIRKAYFARRHSRGNWLSRTWGSVSSEEWVYYLPLGLLAGYSLWLGSANAYTVTQSIPLGERYALLPQGVFKTLTTHLGFGLLSAATALNLLLLQKSTSGPGFTTAVSMGRWLLAFGVLYLLLLPLGGYRPARPLIVRYDTIMPVTLCLFAFVGYTSYEVARGATARRLRWYLPLMALFGLAFANADRPSFDRNVGQRRLVSELQTAAPGDTLVLDDAATLMRWTPVREAAASTPSVTVLRRWGVVEGAVWYRQE